MTIPIPMETDSLPPPPPYSPRDDSTPSSSAEASPTSRNIHLDQLEHGNDNGPSHDYSAYEQVLPETDPNPTEPDEPLPAYHPGPHRSNVDRNLDLPDVSHPNAVPNAPCGRPIPSGVSRHPAPSAAWTARAPSCPANLARESLQSTPSGVSALQRAIDLTRQLSERSADQVARSVRAGLTPLRDQPRCPAPVRITSSSSSSSLEDSLSGPDYRALDNLDLTGLRTSIANLMRDPGNQDDVLQAVSRLRDDLHNRRDQIVPKQQVREFKAEILANRKKVRAMREEAKAARKAEDEQSRRAESSPPAISIHLRLSSNVLRRSDKELISLIVTTQLLHSTRPVTLDVRGQFGAETVLEDAFRFQHFEWFDLTTGHVVEMEPHEGLCDPGDELHPYQVVTLRPGSPLVTSQVFDPISPLCDPVMALKSGHEYRIRLRPQQVWWIAKTTEELFGDKDSIPVNDLPDVPFVRLESADELRLKVKY